MLKEDLKIDLLTLVHGIEVTQKELNKLDDEQSISLSMDLEFAKSYIKNYVVLKSLHKN